MANLFIESGKLIKQAGDNNGIIAEATNISCQYKFKNASAATGVEISTALADLLQRIQAIENTPSAPVITLNKGSLNGVVQSFTVKSDKAGTLTLSTNAGTLNQNSIIVAANVAQTFTLTGNSGTDATAPEITLTEGSLTNNQCTFTVKSTKAGTLTLSTNAGTLSKTSLTMEANNAQTVTITNNGTSTINPTITASQTVAGTKGGNINYTVTVQQTVNSVQGSATSTGTITGTTGSSATGSKELTISNIPVAQQEETYNWYLGLATVDQIQNQSYINGLTYNQTSIKPSELTLPAGYNVFVCPSNWGIPTITDDNGFVADSYVADDLGITNPSNKVIFVQELSASGHININWN